MDQNDLVPSHALGALYSNNTPTQKNSSIQKYGNGMLSKNNPVRHSENVYSSEANDYLSMQMAKNENIYGSVKESRE